MYLFTCYSCQLKVFVACGTRSVNRTNKQPTSTQNFKLNFRPFSIFITYYYTYIVTAYRPLHARSNLLSSTAPTLTIAETMPKSDDGSSCSVIRVDSPNVRYTDEYIESTVDYPISYACKDRDNTIVVSFSFSTRGLFWYR